MKIPRKSWTPVLALCMSFAAPAWAIEPPGPESTLHLKQMSRPELTISSSNVRLEGPSLSSPDWSDFLSRYGEGFTVYVDPRSGAVSNLLGRVPILPAEGAKVDAAAVGDLVRGFAIANQKLLGVDGKQLGPVQAEAVRPDLWQISIPQVVDGIPVRYGRLAATVSQGNLVLLGAETWGDVKINTRPSVAPEQAEAVAFQYADGRQSEDRVWKTPQLEIVPVAAGEGYGHRLVWAFGFERPPDPARWEALVDAHTGELIAFQDANQYADEHIVGGTYPYTNTEVCTLGPYGLIDYGKCGVMQSFSPMPWTDTGQPAPDDFTDGAGVFNWLGGTVTTTLNGLFTRIVDTCGPISESSVTGSLDMGGSNGEHDCTVPPGSASLGNTAASRSCFNEINKLAELARGWLPANPWLLNQIRANVNLNNVCNAFYSPGAGTINFYKSGGGCRNTGELAAVFDHEWGHALDDNDTGGVLSNSSEAYADIVANYRLQTSCVGFGFRDATGAAPCGYTADGTGVNRNEALVGPAHCDLDCSGVRDADWDMHADHNPDTPQNFVCPSCSSGPGPCGRQVHCAAAPVRQAAWDFAARDLQTAPFLLDTNSAFITASKIFYQGSGNVGLWHSCSCAAGTSDGCGAASGYMQWLAADDDNGNLTDGTPHMTALYDAYNRHNIACATPTPQNGGCAGAPTAAPQVTINAGPDYVKVSWTAVPNATKYWVLRSEGFTGCYSGKTLIATVLSPGLDYADFEVLPGRQYCYSIVAVGASDACFGPASVCACTTPNACIGTHRESLLKEDFSLGIPATWTVIDGGVGGGPAATWTDADPCGHTVGAPFVAPWAMVDSKCASSFPPAQQDEQLITHRFDASSCRKLHLQFSNQFLWNPGGSDETGDVDVSVDGGITWTNVIRLENGNDGYPKPNTRVVDLTQHAAGEPHVLLRFHYYNGESDYWWAIDNVAVICTCPGP